eukprot:m.392709 g.392709  ORF g.392709 m.392709 type:complete len:169 (+) comp20087_c1_seq14:2412-2918(+)
MTSLYLLKVLSNSTLAVKATKQTPARKKKRKSGVSEVAAVTPASVGAVDTDRVAKWLGTGVSKLAQAKHSHIKPSFFQDLARKLPGIAWLVAPTLVTGLGTSCNDFRAVTVMSIIASLLQQKASLLAHIPQLQAIAHDLRVSATSKKTYFKPKALCAARPCQSLGPLK